MRIVVIGATGNVGTAILRRLHAADEVTSIVGVSRFGPERRGEPYEGVEWRRIDVGDEASGPLLEDAVRGADAVVHLSWLIRPNRDRALLRRTNVDGSRRVAEAVVGAGVPHLVVASSVGAYGRADAAPTHGERADEAFPRHGASTSHYAVDKRDVERILDDIEAAHPSLAVARLRPALIFQAEAGPAIKDYFLGALVPRALLRALPLVRLPILPWPDGIVTQAVHADDVADACWRVLRARAVGAFNIAAEPPLEPATVGPAVGARAVLRLPLPVLRAVVAVTYRLRLQPTDPGWIDMAAVTPVMETTRIRELGWTPRRTSLEAVGEVIARLGERAGLGNALHRSRSPLE